MKRPTPIFPYDGSTLYLISSDRFCSYSQLWRDGVESSPWPRAWLVELTSCTSSGERQKNKSGTIRIAKSIPAQCALRPSVISCWSTNNPARKQETVGEVRTKIFKTNLANCKSWRGTKKWKNRYRFFIVSDDYNIVFNLVMFQWYLRNLY